jgi:hypothetical protein
MVLAFLPYFIMITVFMGSMHMAIDTTAGERERKSLEPLLINPLPRWQIMAGKLAATTSFALMTLGLGLIAFVYAMGFLPVADMDIALNLDLRVAALAFVLVAPAALLAAALLTILAAFAKSFREAQSYMGLVILVPMIPSFWILIDPTRTETWMTLVPLLSQNVLILELVRGEPVNAVVRAVDCQRPAWRGAAGLPSPAPCTTGRSLIFTSGERSRQTGEKPTREKGKAEKAQGCMRAFPVSAWAFDPELPPTSMPYCPYTSHRHRLILVTLLMLALWAWQLKSRRADWVDAAWAAASGCWPSAMPWSATAALEKRILVALVAGTWSFRLTRHLAVRLAGHDHEDGRYQAMREHFGARANRFFLVFFHRPGADCLAVCIAGLGGRQRSGSAELSVWVILGVAVWLISLAGESIADRQLAAFRNEPEQPRQGVRHSACGATRAIPTTSSNGCTGSAIR